MKHKMRSELRVAVVAAIGAGITLSVAPDVTWAQAVAQTKERIEVTGSNIKRVDTETVAPVEIITRQQIERSGAANIAELMRNIPSATGGSFSESFTNSFASGASGISLRGLGQKTTLVLLNGRRVAGYGFAQNLQDTFVDLNTIPTSAIERIEVLKDGASAIYGSDAIAGVVNIILRHDYRGAEISVSGGGYEGKKEYRADVTAGAGDLARDGWNAFGTFDFYHRDNILFSDTEFMKTRDFRNRPGGRNFIGLQTGGTWRQLNATDTALTTNFRAISECPGVVMTGPQARAAGLAGFAVNATANFDAATNTFCTFDQASQLSALPKADRFGFIGRFTKEFSSTATAYADLGLSRNKNFQVFTSPIVMNTTALQQTAAGLRPFTFNVNFAPGSAGNPFTADARYSGNRNELGTRDQETVSDTYRLVGGLTYSLFGWDLDSAVGWSRNEINQDNFRRTTLAGVSSALGVTTAVQPPVPRSTAATYNLDRPSQDSQAQRDALLADPQRKATSELTFVDTKGSVDIGQMPGGMAALAIGADFRKEKLSDRPDPLASSGGILAQGITATDGSRNQYALFGEFSLPVLRNVEMQIAGRFDHYSDYGNSSTPKIGIKIHPHPTLLLRANWGRGFRAPTLPEISPSVATFFVQVNDPVTGQNGVQISGVFAGNPNLLPEKSISSTVGLIWEPTNTFSMGVNYYEIDWRNIVSSPSFQSIVNSRDPTRVIRDPVTNNIVTVLNNYINIRSTVTHGLDFEARYKQPTPFGTWVARTNVSYVDSFKENDVEVAGTNGGANTIPRTRAQVGIDWDWHAFSATANWNYIRGWSQQLLGSSFFTPQDPAFQNGVYPDRIPDYKTIDLFASYQLTKNLKIAGAVLNATDKLPPYDPGFSSTFLYDFSVFDVRGRQYRATVTYKF